MQIITNPKAGQIVKASQLLQKKHRLATGRFLIEGPNAVLEAVAAGVQIQVIYITAKARASLLQLDRLADSAGIKIELVTEQVLTKLSDTVTPQGVVAVAKQSQNSELTQIADHAQLMAVLVDVRDPGNAGAVVRAADAAGADAVVFAGDSIDPWHPKVVRATTGSLFHLPVLRYQDTALALQQLAQAGLTTVATDLAGSDITPADPLLKKRLCWVFGNEAKGLDAQTVAACHSARKLPLYGKAESLNLATAAAVCLYTSAFAKRAQTAADR